MSESPPTTFRWQTYFQHSTQPIFLLNKNQRLLFVNRAWETCMGLTLAEVRGRRCRRRITAAPDDSDVRLSACAPPREVMKGKGSYVRRRMPGSSDWLEICFLPLVGAQDLLGILGISQSLEAPQASSFSLPEKLMSLRDQQLSKHRLEELDLGSAVLRRLYDQARLASQTSCPIALLGEPGSGKQWLARSIHACSDQKHRYFLCLDAKHLPADFIGEFLIGVRGKQLDLGAVYLREPALLSREWQGRLIEYMRMNGDAAFPRLYLGFCNDPLEAIRTGSLLEEFYCAASTITLQVPPLRERLAELPGFIELFLQRERSFHDHAVLHISVETMNILRAYRWPGNLSELQEILRKACHRSTTDRMELVDLPFHLKHGSLPEERHLPLDELLEQVERRLIELAMKLAKKNQTRAAEILGIWRPRLLRRLEKFEMKGS